MSQTHLCVAGAHTYPILQVHALGAAIRSATFATPLQLKQEPLKLINPKVKSHSHLPVLMFQ